MRFFFQHLGSNLGEELNLFTEFNSSSVGSFPFFFSFFLRSLQSSQHNFHIDDSLPSGISFICEWNWLNCVTLFVRTCGVNKVERRHSCFSHKQLGKADTEAGVWSPAGHRSKSGLACWTEVTEHAQFPGQSVTGDVSWDGRCGRVSLRSLHGLAQVNLFPSCHHNMPQLSRGQLHDVSKLTLGTW